jgi:hypothetical protein
MCRVRNKASFSARCNPCGANIEELNARGKPIPDDGSKYYQRFLKCDRPWDFDINDSTQLQNIVMTQHSIKKELKIFGKTGADAVVNEMQQLHDRSVIEQKKANMLTREEKHKALQYLMFLKKKRCGRIKGRGCADGRKQRIYKTKEETTAPTVAVESLMLLSIIDAKEQ